MNYKKKAILVNFSHLIIVFLMGVASTKVNFFVGMAVGWLAFIVHWKAYEYAKKYFIWKNNDKKIQ